MTTKNHRLAPSLLCGEIDGAFDDPNAPPLGDGNSGGDYDYCSGGDELTEEEAAEEARCVSEAARAESLELLIMLIKAALPPGQLKKKAMSTRLRRIMQRIDSSSSLGSGSLGGGSASLSGSLSQSRSSLGAGSESTVGLRCSGLGSDLERASNDSEVLCFVAHHPPRRRVLRSSALFRLFFASRARRSDHISPFAVREASIAARAPCFAKRRRLVSRERPRRAPNDPTPPRARPKATASASATEAPPQLAQMPPPYVPPATLRALPTFAKAPMRSLRAFGASDTGGSSLSSLAASLGPRRTPREDDSDGDDDERERDARGGGGDGAAGEGDAGEGSDADLELLSEWVEHAGMVPFASAIRDLVGTVDDLRDFCDTDVDEFVTDQSVPKLKARTEDRPASCHRARCSPPPCCSLRCAPTRRACDHRRHRVRASLQARRFRRALRELGADVTA